MKPPKWGSRSIIGQRVINEKWLLLPLTLTHLSMRYWVPFFAHWAEWQKEFHKVDCFCERSSHEVGNSTYMLGNNISVTHLILPHCWKSLLRRTEFNELPRSHWITPFRCPLREYFVGFPSTSRIHKSASYKHFHNHINIWRGAGKWLSGLGKQFWSLFIDNPQVFCGDSPVDFLLLSLLGRRHLF